MTPEELESLEAVVVDARGVSCPGPLLEAKKGIGAVPMDGTIEIWSGDPGTRNDIPAWCKKVGHEFRGLIEDEGYDRIFVTRKK